MVPNIARNGRSFRGAALYYLHDKAADKDLPREQKPTSDDRVAFIDTRNLVHDDPEAAIDEMWATADAQAHLKREAGLKPGGRKCTEPVKTLSLSWHPSERPGADEMIAAADRFLERMGWQEHQAVYIGHSDTAHPHIHIILNRVHPETGRVLDDYKDFPRAQAWALDYEREQGRIWCEKRLETERQQGMEGPRPRAANDSLPHDVVMMARPAEAAFAREEVVREETGREELDARDRDRLKQAQRAEREAWFEEGRGLFKATRNAVWREVKEEYREAWGQYFADRSAAEQTAAAAGASAVGRALWFARQGELGEAWSALSDHGAVADNVTATFEVRRRELRTEQMAEVRERQDVAITALRASREQGYRELLERQQGERAEMRAIHAQGGRADHLLDERAGQGAANENVSPRTPVTDSAVDRQPQQGEPVPILAPRAAGAAADRDDKAAIHDQHGTAIELPELPADPGRFADNREAAAVADRAAGGMADLASAGLGGAASYISDQLSELFAPTPPDVREARAKAQARAEAEAEAEAHKPANPYLRHSGAAEAKTEQEREEKQRDAYWRERWRERDR